MHVLETEADVRNPVLEAEQEAQNGKGAYRKLEKGAVVKAICAGFGTSSGSGKTLLTLLYARKILSFLIQGKMSEKFGVLLCVLILLWGTCLGKFIVEKNSLKLTSPESIKGVYDCAIGSFGVPQYARILVGTVIYPKANQCSCRNFDDYGISFKSKPGEIPTILLVDRGDCFLSLKVSYAQKAGAAAVLIADYLDEPLITMYTPEDDNVEYLEELNITIPSAFISKSLGDSIKKALQSGEMVNIVDQLVKYEFWTTSNYECGPNCDNQLEFVKKFKGTAKILEQKGYTQFTPHYKTWYCPKAFTLTKQCKSQCINHGRYRAPDPEQDFTKGYDGIDVTKIDKCIGDPDADVENPVLKAELEAQGSCREELFSRQFVLVFKTPCDLFV
ncbi:hypothetical protein COLO4_09225 [Corchorus olitorius]|uniref:Uncharacterized protein n=1 Tax=Corchorus olitorius TaxID=93759 RepID=A0A1R3KCS1_9ROSI|nr:hypothetical protein COLO4_09225 [Corchorus olitorius]